MVDHVLSTTVFRQSKNFVPVCLEEDLQVSLDHRYRHAAVKTPWIADTVASTAACGINLHIHEAIASSATRYAVLERLSLKKNDSEMSDGTG